MCPCTRWFQGEVASLEPEDPPEQEYFPQRHPWRYWGLRAALVGALVLFFTYHPAFAQVPPVMSSRECAIVAEMVMSGRALDKHGVSGEQADKIMADFYRQLLEQPAGWRVQRYLDAVKHFVTRPQARAIEPHELGDAFSEQCNQSGGNVGKIFGTDS